MPMRPAEPIILWGVGTVRTMRAHWVLQELGLSYETRAIGSRTGETQTDDFQALNPRGKIPVLQLGELTLAESAAIVTTLAERYPSAGLVPEVGSSDRARYYQWCFWVMTELDAHTLYVLRRHVDLSDLYGEAPSAVDAAREYFAWQLQTAAKEIAARGPFLLGETFTGADILLTSCLDWAIAYGLEIGEQLGDYRSKIAVRPAYQAAFELNFAEMLALAKQR